jgi:molybdopterin-containing oxidoreductase family iron-sulfur binding subunit
LFASGLRVERTERTHDFAQTQEHWEMEGRELVRESTLTEYRDQPDVVSSHHSEPLPLWDEHSYTESPQWGMVIDLNACIGCNACVTACQSENNIPIVGKEQVAKSREMHWLRVDRYVAGTPDDPEVVFQPVPCMHCENAPCEQVCPVGATVHSEDGLNSMVYNRCIGTRYCSNNCPYKVRRFNFFNYTKDLPETLQMLMNPDVTVRSRGVMEKCSYCVQRINAVRIEAKQTDRAIRDGEVRTACQQTCPAEAIVFGDVNDLQSDVAQQKADPRHYVLLEELNHKPRTSFLAKLRNPNPAWGAL